jgi:RNA polymerase sigma factor (sigma-70 family)
MANTRSCDLMRQVRTLFESGTVTGLSDGELLERFRAGSDTAAEYIQDAEAAFEVLVARHGPMVLGVCRRALSDPGDVEDAFQATFLVLVRRARSVRAGDSLGRWLYGVSRRVAAKARARSQRARIRTTPLEVEPTAPNSASNHGALLAALDDELSRLPAKYRAPVVLCHLEGLSHAAAAARLHWPVGTVSGRLSRARGLLKDRLVRRGMAPTEGSLSLLLAVDGARAPVSEQLAAGTVRAAVWASRGGASPAEAASGSALALMYEVVRAAIVVKLKVATAILLAIAFAGAAAVQVGAGAGVHTQSEARASGRQPAVSSNPPLPRSAAHRPADEIVKEIETLKKTARRPAASQGEWDQRDWAYCQIAALVDELRTAYPDDPRVTRYLPERWECLTFLNRRADIHAEIEAVLRTAKEPALKKEALLFETCLRFLYKSTDGRTAVSLAEAFAREAPGDNRAGELLYLAAGKLDDGWYTRVGLVVLLAVAGALTLWTARKRRAGTRGWLLKLGVRLGGVVLVLLVALLFGFQFLSYDGQNAIYGSFFERLSALRNSNLQGTALFIAYVILNKVTPQLQSIARSGWTGLAVALASATSLFLVLAHRRSVGTPTQWTSTARLAFLGFIAVLAVSGGVDAFLIARQQRALRDRVVREFRDFFKDGEAPWERRQRECEARLADGQRRQRERIGEPFELDFADAITGRPVSVKALRGKVVVVNFWPAYGGLMPGHIPKMKGLYAEYHDKGVEFIGVSIDVPEESGGLEALKAFVAKEQIPWPQYLDSHPVVSRPGPTDRLLASVQYYQCLYRYRDLRSTVANEFSESWGISLLPTVFLIDAEGKLYSTEAEGELDTLIPLLLEKARASSSGR